MAQIMEMKRISARERLSGNDTADISIAMGAFCDLMSDFTKHRDSTVKLCKSEASTESRKPLCAQRTSAAKFSAMLGEIQMLMERYRNNYGRMRGLLSELKARPTWQKLPQWVEPSKATCCFKCNRRLRLISQKINCRVGGQVFCSDCCTDQIVIYAADAGDIMWAVNGKPGGPSTTPKNYSLLPVCSSCSQELQVIVLDTANGCISQSTKFLKHLHYIHQNMAMLEMNLDMVLPKYLHLVDALNMNEGSPKSVEEQNPLQYLARAQADLTDAFDVLAAQSQKLKDLKSTSETEEKLKHNVVQCTSSRFLCQKSRFQLAKNQLSEIMPANDLEKIQKSVSERSIEDLYTYLQQLIFELSCLIQIYGFENDFFDPIKTIIHSIEEEQPSLINCKDKPSTSRVVSEESNKLIHIDTHITNPQAVRYIIISQIFSSLHEHFHQLLEKTIGREYLGTKESVSKSLSKLDSLLTTSQCV